MEEWTRATFPENPALQASIPAGRIMAIQVPRRSEAAQLSVRRLPGRLTSQERVVPPPRHVRPSDHFRKSAAPAPL